MKNFKNHPFSTFLVWVLEKFPRKGGASELELIEDWSLSVSDLTRIRVTIFVLQKFSYMHKGEILGTYILECFQMKTDGVK